MKRVLLISLVVFTVLFGSLQMLIHFSLPAYAIIPVTCPGNCFVAGFPCYYDLCVCCPVEGTPLIICWDECP